MTREKHLLVVKFRGDAPLDPVRLVQLVEARPDMTLTPPAVVRVDLDARGRRRRGRLVDEPTSWWTSRATAGRVTEGFTKQEVLNSDRIGADDDVLLQIGGLLTELGAGA